MPQGPAGAADHDARRRRSFRHAAWIGAAAAGIGAAAVVLGGCGRVPNPTSRTDADLTARVNEQMDEQIAWSRASPEAQDLARGLRGTLLDTGPEGKARVAGALEPIVRKMAAEEPEALQGKGRAFLSPGLAVDDGLFLSGVLKKAGQAVTPPLVALLGARDPLLRRGAVVALEEPGGQDPDVIRAVAGRLEDPDPEVRRCAAVFVQRSGLGDPATEGPLSRLLRDEDPFLRRQAAAALLVRQPGDERARQVFRDALAAPDAVVRAEAAYRLFQAEGKQPGPVGGLPALLDDRRAEVRAAAALPLLARGRDTDRCWRVLAAGMESHDPGLRETAVHFLREASNPRCPELVNEVVRALEHPDPAVRAAAAWSRLWLYFEVPDVQTLRRDLRTPEPRVRLRTALYALWYAPQLAQAADVLEEARSVLAEGGAESRRTVALLREALHFDVGVARGRAAELLRLLRAGGRDAVPDLVRLRKDRLRYVRDAAADALTDIDPATARKNGAAR